MYQDKRNFQINIMEYTGYNQHRLKDNDPYHKKECDFTKAINQEMKLDRMYLAAIVGVKQLTLHEEKLILSTIQWLGTPVGQGFLDKVSNM